MAVNHKQASNATPGGATRSKKKPGFKGLAGFLSAKGLSHQRLTPMKPVQD